MATYTSQYPTLDTSHVKATNEYSTNYAYNACNPNNDLTKGWIDTPTWISYPMDGPNNCNMRFHIDLGSAYIIKRIYLENAMQYWTTGVKDFTFWGSNDGSSFAELTYATDTGWTQLTTSITQWAQHVELLQADPQYALVTNTTAYRYYAFKFPNNWGRADMDGITRLELQTEDIILPDTPTNSSPTNSATDVSINPTLESSAFSSDAEVTHKASQWQVATDSGFSSIVWDSGTSTTNKTSCIVNATNGTFAGALSEETALGTETAYYFRIKHQDSSDNWSEYSTGTSFTTEAGGATGILTLNTKWW